MDWVFAICFMVLGALLFVAIGTATVYLKDKHEAYKQTRQYRKDVVWDAWMSGKLVTLDNKPFDFGEKDG
jgi:hypothetical protein